MSTSDVATSRINLPGGLLGLPADSISIGVTENTYLPAGEIEHGWLPLSVRALRALKGPTLRKKIGFVGCGAALEAIAAANIFRPTTIALIDIHNEVALSGADNLQRNLPSDLDTHVVALSGNLCEPLKGQSDFDLLYENLPNVPSNEDIDEGILRASFFTESELSTVPAHVADVGLTMHYTFLMQAKKLLSATGSAACCIGSRIDPEQILDILSATGMRGRVVAYGPVAQLEAGLVVPKYSELEAKSGRVFKFFGFNQLSTRMTINTVATAEDDLLSAVLGFWRKNEGIKATEAQFDLRSRDGHPRIAHIGTCFEFRPMKR